MEVSLERFEELVADALDEIPEDLWRVVDNVAVRVQEGIDGSSLLGLYEGVPLTHRRGYGEGMVMPDRITIFRRPILSVCETPADVVHEVRVTVIHEVAHHFGIDDERLHELGWG